MAISPALRTRLNELSTRLGPDDLERIFFSRGLSADPSSTKDILLRFIESRGVNVENYRIRRDVIVDITDGDTLTLHRVFMLFVLFFYARRYPRLLANS